MRNNRVLIILLVVSFLFRLLLVPVARHGDINNNVSWGNLLIQRGTDNFYEGSDWPNSSPNQPPLYLYLFGITSFTTSSLNSLFLTLNAKVSVFPSQVIWTWQEWGELFVVKTPAILADLGIAFVIYKFFEKKKKIALSLAALWLFNPVSWYNSAIWGGTDSIVNLLGLISVYLLLQKKNLIYAAVFIVLSILFKGSLVLLIPLLILLSYKQKHKVKVWVRAGVICIVLVLVLSMPFHLQLDLPFYLLSLYTNRFFPGEIGSLTANAFNLWWLVDPGLTLDSTAYAGLPARVWGMLIMAVGYLFILFKSKKASSSRALISLSLIPLVSFLFMTRIHERYMYPFFPLATVALGYVSWLWVPYLIFSLTHLLNLYHLFWAPGIPLAEAWYLNPPFMVIISIVNLASFLYVLYRYNKAL